MANRIPRSNFILYNANTLNHNTNDCVVRAISKALSIPYETLLRELCELACLTSYMPNDEIVWVNYIEDEGWVKRKVPRHADGTRYTVNEFTKLHTQGVYLLKISRHLTVCAEGCIYDTWDCRDRLIISYYEREETN